MDSDGREYGEILYIPQTSFEIRQREYFADLLERKWECNVPGHTVCVPTEDNQHYQLSDESFKIWVNALCLGKATTSQPPDGLLMPKSSVDESSTSVVRAVSIPPSHRRNVRSPILAATASIRNSLSSRPSSGALGPGYYSAKAIEWLGQKSINGIEAVIISTRCRRYRYLLKQWSSSAGDAARRKRDKQFFAMLEDLLELSRDYYSDRVRERALDIAHRANDLATNPTLRFNEKGRLTWSLNCVLCIISLNSSKGTCGSSDFDFKYALLESLTKVPLALQGTHAATSVICILGSELLYSTHDTRSLTLVLTHMLLSVLSLVPVLRDLSVEEMHVIHSLAMRRLERQTQTSNIFCRPWEVVIVGRCSMGHPRLEEIVRGPCGIPSLVQVLDTLLEMDMDSFPEDYSTAMADVLEALRGLARCGWIAEIATEHVVAHIVTVLGGEIGILEARYCCLCILAEIFAYRPPLLHGFVQLGGGAALLETLSFIRRQPSTHRGDNGRKTQSIEHVNDFLRRIEQASSQQ